MLQVSVTPGTGLSPRVGVRHDTGSRRGGCQAAAESTGIHRGIAAMPQMHLPVFLDGVGTSLRNWPVKGRILGQGQRRMRCCGLALSAHIRPPSPAMPQHPPLPAMPPPRPCRHAGYRSGAFLDPSAWADREFWPSLELSVSAPAFAEPLGLWVAKLSPPGSGRRHCASEPGCAFPLASRRPDPRRVRSPGGRPLPLPCSPDREQPPERCAESDPS
jgi:hypothetical protein